MTAALLTLASAFGQDAKALNQEGKSALDPQIQFNLGLASLRGGKPAEAIGPLRKALADPALAGEAHYLLGAAYFESGEFSKVAAELENLRTSPHAEHVLFMIEESERLTHRSAEARNAFHELNTRFPDSPWIHFLMGNAFENQANHEKAIAEYQAALAKNPALPNANFAVGYIKWKDRAFDEAKPWLQKELSIQPCHALASYYLAEIAATGGDAETAIRFYRRAIECGDPDAKSHLGLGIVLTTLDRNQEALKELQLAARLEPTTATPHYRLALLYRKLGRKAEADAEYERVKEIHASGQAAAVEGLKTKPPPSAAAEPYVGPEACAPCHPQEYSRQTKSSHARALRPILASGVAPVLLDSTRIDSSIRYDTRTDGIAATANRDGAQATGLLEWAFGAGAQGITPVGRLGDRFFEHRFSYYSATGRMALTFGHPPSAETPETMLGMLQSSHTIATCFGCHATGTLTTSDLSNIQLGVRCENCHGPGRRHIEIAKTAAPTPEIRRAILNPGRLSAKAQVEACGRCHRLPAAENASPEPELADPVTVRYAPIGLMASRCFLQSKKLACTTCHNPHEDAKPRTDASYAGHCATCHTSAPKPNSSCRRASGQNCVPCHMQQTSLGPYLKFTDHRIRIN